MVAAGTRQRSGFQACDAAKTYRESLKATRVSRLPSAWRQLKRSTPALVKELALGEGFTVLPRRSVVDRCA